MQLFINLLKEQFAYAIKQLNSDASQNEVTQATQIQFGDYQCNAAMKLTKSLKRNPREIAQAIVSHINHPFIDKLEIAGPGFINIFLTNQAIEQTVNQMAADSRLGIPKPKQPEKIIVEFSSPNIAKELHVGHLRSTIIGDSLARLFEFLGHNVLRLNHVGDWGTAFGMLIAHMKETHPEVLKGSEDTDLGHLVNWYKESKQRFDADDEFKKRSRLEVVALQSGNADNLRAWEIICAISRKAFTEIYSILDVEITERGESFYNPKLEDVVADLDTKGLVTVSEGAKCIFLEGFHNREGEPLPMIVQKSDGGFNYSTTDMAAIRHRLQEEKADRVIVVTDAGQATHFAMIFKAAQQAGYYDPAKQRIDHVPFGLVLGPDGKKFRTREGETEKLIDLLTTAIDKARDVLNQKNPNLTEDEQTSLAKSLGISAVKYADLSCNRIGDYTFSYEKMLRFDGNTAAFILYAYVRAKSILEKVLKKDGALPKSSIHVTHPTERDLLLHLSRLGEVLEAMTSDLLPSRLTDYLYHLAEKFHAFFRDCRVEGSEEQESRLLICDLVGRTLKQALDILGIKTVERM